MEITGKQLIAAPRDTVWKALNDPAVLKNCLPGCESVEKLADDEFKVVVAAAIGPLRARFNGTLKIADADAPRRCTMVFEGQGGAVGFGKGSSDVQLDETAEGTALSYTAKAQVGGKLAQVGSRLIDSVAKKMSDDFFNAFRKQLAPAAPASPAPAAQVKAASAAAEAPATAKAAAPAPSAAVPAAAPAMVPAMALAGHPAAHGMATVPAWWLPVAAFVGAATAIAGAVLVR